MRGSCGGCWMNWKNRLSAVSGWLRLFRDARLKWTGNSACTPGLILRSIGVFRELEFRSLIKRLAGQMAKAAAKQAAIRYPTKLRDSFSCLPRISSNQTWGAEGSGASGRWGKDRGEQGVEGDETEATSEAERRSKGQGQSKIRNRIKVRNRIKTKIKTRTRTKTRTKRTV